MRLSRRSEYGLRALVDLVRHEGEGPIPLTTLAGRNRLPVKFLEQIMATLKHAGIVRTTLGTHGGYAMAAEAVGGLDRAGRPAARRGARAAAAACRCATTSRARARTRRPVRCATP